MIFLPIFLFESCNQSKTGQPYSPTSSSSNSDSTGVAGEKGKGTGKKDSVSSVVPMLPSYGPGNVYYTSTYEWMIDHYVPATSHNGTYTMFTADNFSAANCVTMYQYYGFRRAVCQSGDNSKLVSAGFSPNQLLVQIGSQGLNSNWYNTVLQYANTVLGYYIDEPSGFITGATMQKVADSIHVKASKLWLDDYDTGVISKIYFPVHNYHLADAAMLRYGDYIMNDADNSYWCNGNGGIGCYTGQDYDEFQTWFSPAGQPIFNTIWTMPAYYNEGSVVNWMDAHLNSNISNYAVYFPSNWSSIDLDSFAAWAYQAGFLGQYQNYKQQAYVCQLGNVSFTPGPGGAGDYFGVWNGTCFTGPVSSTTPGATICWEREWVPTSQYQTVYTR